MDVNQQAEDDDDPYDQYSKLLQFAEAQAGADEKSRRAAIPAEQQIIDESIARLNDSPEVRESNRLIRLSERLRAIVDWLDRFKDIDDAWTFALMDPPSGQRPERKPSSKSRWQTARRHLDRILIEIRATLEAARGLSDDACVYLSTIEHEVCSRQAQCLALEKAQRPFDAIILLKKTLRTARWRVSRDLANVASRAMLDADAIKKRAINAYLPAHATGAVPKAQPRFTLDELADSLWLGSRRIAELMNLNESAVTTALSRLRIQQTRTVDWRENEDSKKGAPRFVHKLSSALPTLQKMQPHHETDL